MPTEYGAGMVPILHPSTSHRVRGIGCALLWGVVELVALARLRWSARRACEAKGHRQPVDRR